MYYSITFYTRLGRFTGVHLKYIITNCECTSMYNDSRSTSQGKQERSALQLPKFTVKFEIENVIVKTVFNVSKLRVQIPMMSAVLTSCRKYFVWMSLNPGSFVSHDINYVCDVHCLLFATFWRLFIINIQYFKVNRWNNAKCAINPAVLDVIGQRDQMKRN